MRRALGACLVLLIAACTNAPATTTAPSPSAAAEQTASETASPAPTGSGVAHLRQEWRRA